MSAWVNLGMGSLAIAAMAVTVTRAKVFRWLRDWVAKRSEFWGELFSCTYCFAHWLSIAYVLLCRQHAVVTDTGFWWLDYIVSIFAVVTVSTMVAGYGIVRAQDS